MIVLCALIVAGRRIEWRLARRWVASDWSYRRIQNRVLGLTLLGLLVWNLYGVFEDGGDVGGIGVSVLLLLGFFLHQQSGPAAGESLRKRAHPPRETFFERHPDAGLFLLIAGVSALGVGAVLGLASIDAQLADLALAFLIAGSAAFTLRVLVSTHREKRALGFNPDYYLAVDRRIGDENRRPELLMHQPSKQPEYSGWYAYADERDEHSPDLVAWSLKDLIDHSPEAAHPFREGRGKWKWDPRLGAYKPIERHTETVST
jgi:hypothetical protein